MSWDIVGSLLVPGHSCPDRNILWLVDELIFDKGQALVLTPEIFLAPWQHATVTPNAVSTLSIFKRSCSAVLRRIFQFCRSVVSFSIPFSSSLQRVMMKDIPVQQRTFAGIDGYLQSPMLLRGNWSGWKYSWDCLGVSRMCILLDTFCDLRIGVTCACLCLHATPGSFGPIPHYQGVWHVVHSRYLHRKLFCYHIGVPCWTLVG